MRNARSTISYASKHDKNTRFRVKRSDRIHIDAPGGNIAEKRKQANGCSILSIAG